MQFFASKLLHMQSDYFWLIFVLFCFVLFCFVLFCFVLFCFVIFWFHFLFRLISIWIENVSSRLALIFFILSDFSFNLILFCSTYLIQRDTELSRIYFPSLYCLHDHFSPFPSLPPSLPFPSPFLSPSLPFVILSPSVSPPLSLSFTLSPLQFLSLPQWHYSP